jgi:hypothetical protein
VAIDAGEPHWRVREREVEVLARRKLLAGEACLVPATCLEPSTARAIVLVPEKKAVVDLASKSEKLTKHKIYSQAKLEKKDKQKKERNGEKKKTSPKYLLY